jgi:predicted metal-dependent phosphotriesterase family hydrolase
MKCPPIRSFQLFFLFALLTGFCIGCASSELSSELSGKIMTVNGPVEPEQVGSVLPHEHIMVDFIGADEVSSSRYEASSVIDLVLPYLEEVKGLGINTLIECTPAYLARDPELLKRLSDSTGIHLVTNTGYYGDEEGQFLPGHVYNESYLELASRWLEEWERGIDGTGIRPGFMKLRVDTSPISETGQKLLKAAAETHLKSGLTIGVHTPDGQTALEQLDILTQEGIDPSAFIWIHAQNEQDTSLHAEAAKRGAWVEFDGISASSAGQHLHYLKYMKEQELLDRVLISQDAGWYRVGEPGGAPDDFRSYNYIMTDFIPALQNEGFSDEEIEMLLRENPQKAFTIHIRSID